MERRILIVEDEKEEAQVLESFLRRKKFTTHLASNIGEALSIIENYKPKIILLDLALGSEYGGDLLGSISNVREHKIVVIAGTKPTLEEILALHRRGVRYFLAKPVIMSSLWAVIGDIE